MEAFIGFVVLAVSIFCLSAVLADNRRSAFKKMDDRLQKLEKSLDKELKKS